MLEVEPSSQIEEPPSSQSVENLKTFVSAGQGHWADLPACQWQDWRWQLQNRITSLDQLQRLAPNLAPEEVVGALAARRKLAMSITPYFFNLIDFKDPRCPIRRQVIPRIEETQTAPGELKDPCDEDSHSPVPGLVHRYPDRVLMLVTDRCASYCRYCTRSRLVGRAASESFESRLDLQIDYIARTPAVRDVLLSGGDPLLLNDQKLESILERLRAIRHVEFLRIGTRVPIFLPQRVTQELCAILRRFHPLFISIHSNHPRELTLEARTALERLADAGIPLGNQSVLLRGVNDNVEVMKAHVQKLLMCRVRPYYLYQCDPVQGTAHLRTTVNTGLEIMRGLRGHTTGYAVPSYVIDAPGGGGKVPICEDSVAIWATDRIFIRNYEGQMFEYRQPPTE